MNPLSPPDYSDHLHVAAAVVVDGEGRVLIAKRAEHRHQGGLWEFPGGKVEPGEAVREALARELHEEVGIDVVSARPLIRIPYDYGDRRVLLDVWRTDAFHGEAHGKEGQPVAWVSPPALSDYAFPAANRPIITAAQLPDACLITPEPGPRSRWPSFLERLEFSLKRGVRLVQLRAKGLESVEYRALAESAAAICRTHGAHLLLNAPAALAADFPDAGLHLSSRALLELDSRPLPPGRWVSAACHNERELEKALAIDVDLHFVSPVQPTASHPGAPVLGWEGLKALCERSRVPVYALGGLGPDDRERAWRCGAQGVAGIRAFWGTEDWFC